MHMRIRSFANTMLVAAMMIVSPASAEDVDGVKGFTEFMMKEYESNADQEIQAFCGNRWTSDFEMQNFCYEKNVAARAKAQEYDLINGAPELMGIWTTCASKWKDEQDLTDWEMMNFCIEKQTAALAKVKARKRP